MTYHNSPTTAQIAQLKADIAKTRQDHALELKTKLKPLIDQLYSVQRKRYIEVYGEITEYEQAKLNKIKQMY